jgi:hypothetical protein
MSESSTYTPGGDAQAIKKIANDYYGSYTDMFEAHGWPERSTQMMPAVQSRVVETYGSVRDFEVAHQRGELMFPMEAIKSKPPNVWLTSVYGFRPEEYGFLGFSDPTMRDSFVKRSKPGVLVVVYGAPKASKVEQGKIIGIQQCSHCIGPSQQFMSPAAWTRKERDPDRAGRWDFAVKATRAWRVTPETWMPVSQFAPETYSSGRGQVIGSRGMPLESREALRILKLDLQEVEVYGETPMVASTAGNAKEILAPSKAGPVSQSSHVAHEAEGPKHLYILKLHGDIDAFLGERANGHFIVKAGFSRSPQIRCIDFNRTLPRCAFRWDVFYSGALSGYEPHPTSEHAKAGERAMQTALCTQPDGRSLGGEFFLATSDLIEQAWKAGNLAAKDYSK